MAIIQISKIQQRSGDLVDLPQLDEAEFGFASDEKRLFIGKTTDNPENIEVLTSYSDVSFSQIDGAVGNLNIDPLTIEEGQVLAYNANLNAWENRGGNSGGLINLGEVSNLTITGGAIGYVLQTDGTGNLSWQPKGVVTLYIENITQNINSVITFTDEFALSNAQQVTITGVTGMTEVNGNSYYLGNLTTTTANLYTDSALSTPLDTSGFGAFPYTSVTATTAVTNDITVGSATDFSINDPVQFIGTVFGGLETNKTYYVLSASVTTLTVSETLGGPEVLLATDSGTCNVYVTGGKAVATVGGGGGGNTGTSSNTQVLFNFNNIPAGDSKFTFDYPTGQLILTGNANVSNLHSTTLVQTSRYISNVATGTAPLTVSSTTKVANLNVDFLDGFDSSQTAVANTVVVRDANANIVGNNFSGTTISLTGNANVGNLGTPGLIVATGNITGGNLNTAGALSVTGNANVGNIGATNGVFTGNVTAGNVYANSGTIGASLLTGTLTTAAQPNVTSVGTLTSLTVSGNANVGNIGATNGVFTGNVNIGTMVTTAITTGANTTAGTITGNWTLTTGSRLEATYADLAEYYAGDKHYPAGTVLDFGGEFEVTLAGIESNRIAGVVSADPAYVMNGMIQCKHPVSIALQGRVPCKVKGKVRKGDMMISAGKGYAKAAITTPSMGTVIGKALSNFDGEEGVIEVVVGRL
jgi:hypothetical protein